MTKYRDGHIEPEPAPDPERFAASITVSGWHDEHAAMAFTQVMYQNLVRHGMPDSLLISTEVRKLYSDGDSETVVTGSEMVTKSMVPTVNTATPPLTEAETRRRYAGGD